MSIMRFKTLLQVITALGTIFVLGCTNNSEINNQKESIHSFTTGSVSTPKPTITPFPTRVSKPKAKVPTRTPRSKPNNFHCSYNGSISSYSWFYWSLCNIKS